MIARHLALVFFAFVVPTHLYAQSFDCRLAKHADERAICSDAVLAELDRSVSVLFALRKTDQTAVRAQRSWLATRTQCNEDVGCLRKIYLNRIDELAQELPKSSSTVAYPEIYNYSCKMDGRTYPLWVNASAHILEWRGSKYTISDLNDPDVCAKFGWHAEKDDVFFDFCTATKGYASFQLGNVEVQCDLKSK